MEKYTINDNVNMTICDELYDNSALTIEGLDLDSINDYANYLDSVCGLKPNATFYVIYGYEMNNFYTLHGKVAYPGDIHIVSIKLNDLVNPDKIITKRFEFGGRWFDDIVDNNSAHLDCD